MRTSRPSLLYGLYCTFPIFLNRLRFSMMRLVRLSPNLNIRYARARIHHLNEKFSSHEELLRHHFVSINGGQGRPLPLGRFKISRFRRISPTPQSTLQLLHSPHSLILQSLESENTWRRFREEIFSNSVTRKLWNSYHSISGRVKPMGPINIRIEEVDDVL